MLSSEGSLSFEERCARTAEEVAGRGRLYFCVCVDGSAASEVGFHATMSLRKKYDFVCVYHAAKKLDGDFVQPNWRPAAIQQHYDDELVSRMLPQRYSIVTDQRNGRSFLETLSHALSHYEPSKLISGMGGHSPDFIVFGVVGRKGSLDDPNKLGSNALGALSLLHTPCIVIKRPLNEGRRKFIYAVNLSPQSKQGLDVLLQLVNAKDSLILIHLYDDAEGDQPYFEELRSYYGDELDKNGPADFDIRLIPKPRGVAITKAVADYVNESGCDFFAIAPRAKQTISSISTYIVNHVEANVIFCKV